LKILLIGEASGVHYNLKRGLLDLGHDVKHMILYGASQGRSYDGSFSPVGAGVVGGVKRNLLPLIMAGRLDNYDAINFVNTITAVHGQHTKYLDLPILRNKSKVLSYYSVGCDQLGLVRRSTRDLPYSPCSTCLSSGESLGRDCENKLNPIYEKSVERAKKYLSVAASGMIEYDHVSDFFKDKKFSRIPLPVDVERINYNPAKNSKKILIAHTPTRRGFKGTSIVLEAMEILKSQRDDFEFIVVENLTYQDYVAVMQTVDIVIDQVYSQSPGMNALEMIAAGKIVFTGATDLGMSYFGFMENFPGFDASPDPVQLAKSISLTLDKKNMFSQWSESGREYINCNHNCLTVAEQFVSLWS
jgi:hypothetical protein